MVLSAFLRPQQRGKTARTCPFLPTFSNPSSTLFSRQPTCAFRPSVKAVIPSIAGKAYTMPGRSRDSTWKSLTRTRDRHGQSIPCQAGKASSPPFPLPLVFQMSLSPMPGGFIWIPSWSMKALVPLIRNPRQSHEHAHGPPERGPPCRHHFPRGRAQGTDSRPAHRHGRGYGVPCFIPGLARFMGWGKASSPPFS